MNINKRCKCCGDYFPAELLSLKVYCDKKHCKEREKWRTETIKSRRSVNMDTFDVYDLDRPRTIHKGEVLDYERVCRKCGEPLKRKEGSYSWSARYCLDHRGFGYTLFAMFSWGAVSYRYKKRIQEENNEFINELADKLEIPENLRDVVTICESCKCLCKFVSNTYWSWNRNDDNKMKVRKLGLVNAHHKIHVSELTKENIELIWDEDNLICVCPTCHGIRHRKPKIELKKKKYYTLDYYVIKMKGTEAQNGRATAL